MAEIGGALCGTLGGGDGGSEVLPNQVERREGVTGIAINE